MGHWGPGRWAAAAPSGGTRADVMHALVQRLADLGAQAEHRAPRPVPRLTNDQSLPDQLRVMIADLLAAPATPAPLLTQATRTLTTTPL